MGTQGYVGEPAIAYPSDQVTRLPIVVPGFIDSWTGSIPGREVITDGRHTGVLMGN